MKLVLLPGWFGLVPWFGLLVAHHLGIGANGSKINKKQWIYGIVRATIARPILCYQRLEKKVTEGKYSGIES